MIKFQTDPSLRRKSRRLALATLVIFVAASTVLHFTVGSIVAAFKLSSPEQPALDHQTVTILTISHLEKDPALTPIAIIPHIKLLHSSLPLVPLKPVKVIRYNHVVVASSVAPVRGSSKTFSGAQKQQTGGRTSVTELARVGYSAQSNVFTNTGSGGDTAGEDPSYPGRQIPNGAVWSDDGPPGQSANAGGVVLGSGGGRPVILIHQSCSPSRGDFIGSF